MPKTGKNRRGDEVVMWTRKKQHLSCLLQHGTHLRLVILSSHFDGKNIKLHTNRRANRQTCIQWMKHISLNCLSLGSPKIYFTKFVYLTSPFDLLTVWVRTYINIITVKKKMSWILCQLVAQSTDNHWTPYHDRRSESWGWPAKG